MEYLEDYRYHCVFSEHKYISELCNPLSILGINGFIFMRQYADYSFVDLATSLDWADFFFERYYSCAYTSEDVINHMQHNGQVALWSQHKQNRIWQEGIEHFSVANGISIHRNRQYYTDIFCFYSKNDTELMDPIYINNLDLLHQFCDYFVKSCDHIIHNPETLRLRVPGRYQHVIASPPGDLQNALRHQFCTTINPVQPIHDSLNVEQLSRREIQCLELCAKGLTARDISEKIYISKRTVETHLYNARSKLQCNNLHELVFQYAKHFVRN